MGNLTRALTIMMAVNVMLFLGQYAVLQLNPSGQVFYDCEGSVLGEFEQEGCTQGTYYLNEKDLSGQLPSTEGSVNENNDNIITDTVKDLRDWMINKLGIGYILAILSAPYNLIKSVGAPDALAWALGAMWYGISLFLLVAWIFARDG